MNPEEQNKNPSDSFQHGGFEDLQKNIRSAIITFALNNAVFKTRVQSSGRISIPEAEREALGIKDGDIVQVLLFPVKKE